MGDNDGDKNRLSSNVEKCTALTEQSISKCLQEFLNYAEKLQDKGAIHFPVQGTNIFRELCNVYANFKECSQDISCSSISLEAVDASYGYMCGEGYKLFENYATCFAEVEIENNYVKCKNEASAAITAAQKAKIPNDYSQYFELLCEVMDHYLRCCRPVINAHCGRGAWELVRTITLDSLRVTMPACDLHNALL
ncbi:Chondroitin proteoglycan 4 family protein [Acanthocheilonema viteae]